MSTFCPTLAQIQAAFSACLQVALAPLTADGSVVIVPPMQDVDADADKIMALSTLQPDRKIGAESGGPGALAVRKGVYLVTLSALRHAGQKTHWDAAQAVEDHFAQYSADPLELPAGGVICCDYPYTTNAGTGPDKRFALLVTVPWWTWSSN